MRNIRFGETIIFIKNLITLNIKKWKMSILVKIFKRNSI